MKTNKTSTVNAERQTHFVEKKSKSYMASKSTVSQQSTKKHKKIQKYIWKYDFLTLCTTLIHNIVFSNDRIQKHCLKDVKVNKGAVEHPITTF